MYQSESPRIPLSQDIAEHELIRLAKEGSLDAFNLLYERYLPVVYKRVWYTVPGQDVEDVVQEVFIAVVRSLRSFRGDAKFTTWLRSLVNRQVADYYRRRSRNPMDTEDASQEIEPATGMPMDDSQIILQQALLTLPDAYREVIVLRFAEGLKFQDIARQQGKSLEAVKSLFRRAMEALRGELGEPDA